LTSADLPGSWQVAHASAPVASAGLTAPVATPTKRLGTPEEVARVIVFLASAANDFVTGQVWGIDGGASLWGDIWPIPEPGGAPEALPTKPREPRSDG